MKKLFVSIVAVLLGISAWAVPAKPGVFTYTQPDGSVVRLERHGDEFFSWTTLAGTSQAVELDQHGFWRHTTVSPVMREAAKAYRAQVNSRRAASVSPRTHVDNPMTHGARHIPVLLVNFSDNAFSIPDPLEAFQALLNQNGYADNGATGSVQDFYMDNSKGQFQPIFDVYGPVTLPHEMAYYGAVVRDNQGRIISNDKNAGQALMDAADLLDDVVDFSQYDTDNDGYVDMTLFYYAGYNQAEWGPDDTIWPHQSWAPASTRYDGKMLGRYFCTSELKGNKNVNMCGIGTTCHEFGHSLGLPDFYDTDYEENGSCHALSSFSTMCSGSYNNDGRTPPYFNAEERIYLGWMIDEDIQEFPKGETVFGSVKDDIAYKTLTDTEGEYFLYECRDGSGWDAPLPTGMLVYHADKSTVRTVGGLTPYQQWYYWDHYNTINAYGDHPCFYVVPASQQDALDYDNRDARAWVFPGSSNITTYAPVDWDGNSTGATLSNISYADAQVSLTVNYSVEKKVMGQVTDASGNGLEGVYVVLTPITNAAGSPFLRQVRPRTPVFEAVTDANGNYLIVVEEFGAEEGHLTFSKDGYQTTGKDVTIKGRSTVVNVRMLKDGELDQRDYYYYDPTASAYVSGVGSWGNTQMAAIHIPAEELAPAGGTITSVAFCPYYKADAYYVIVDAGEERILTYEVPDMTGGIHNLVSVDLQTLDVSFPGGTDLYVGYAVKNATPDYTGYPFLVATGSNTFYSAFNLESSNWDVEENPGYGLIYVANIIGRSKPEEEITSLAQMGIVSIADPGKGSYHAGDVFQLEMALPQGVTPTSVIWQYDGLTVTDPVTLQAGKHTVSALVKYADGSEETFELMIEVK